MFLTSILLTLLTHLFKKSESFYYTLPVTTVSSSTTVSSNTVPVLASGSLTTTVSWHGYGGGIDYSTVDADYTMPVAGGAMTTESSTIVSSHESGGYSRFLSENHLHENRCL